MGGGLYYDALYGYTPFPPYIRRVLDLEVFQRLRGLKQLSTVYLVFPGAVHTRFEHSVGVAHLAGIVHERLREIPPSKGQDPNAPWLNRVSLAAIQLAALCHDIGHGPFGHLFEMFCRRDQRYRRWNHEEFAFSLMTGNGQGPIYQQIPDMLATLKGQLRELNDGPEALLGLLDPENLYRIASGKPPDLGDCSITAKYVFLKDIIPSPYGVDRLDYLRRDAYFSGVNTGNIDVWEIISNLRIQRDGEIHGLFLEPEVAPGVEAILAARAAVYRRLYHNPVHRSAQELIIRGLSELHREPEELVLLTDGELLDMFREEGVAGNDFLREAYDRIKFRILYENIELVSHAEITRYKAVLEENRTRGWAALVEKEEHIANSAGVAQRRKIFYDLERVPVIRPEDFESLIFFDRIDGRPQNLFELQPHLATLYKGTLTPDVEKSEAFIDSVSKIYLSFPFEHISQDIKSASELDKSSWQKEAERIYESKLERMIEAFFLEILRAPDVDHFPVQRIRKQTLAYLLDLISLYSMKFNP